MIGISVTGKNHLTHLAILQLDEILDSVMNESVSDEEGYPDTEVGLPVNQRKSPVSIPLTDIASPKPAILGKNRLVVVEVVPLVVSFGD